MMGMGLGLAACSSSLNGHIYMDSNADGQLSPGEKGIANIPLNITQDGKQIATISAQNDGSYTIPIKGTGSICVTPDKSYLQGVIPKGGIKPSLSISPIIPLIAGESKTPPPPPPPGDGYSPSNPPSKPSGGLPSKSAMVTKDATTTGSTSTGSTSTGTGTDTAASSTPASDPYATTSNTPAAGTVTISDKSGCVQMGLGSQEMDVPIKPNYSTSFTSLQTPPDLTAAPCDNVDWKWVWPNSCTPIQTSIPSAFITVDTEVGIQGDASMSPMLDLSSGVTPDTSIQPTDLTQDALATRVVHLQVKCGLSGDKQTYVLQPKVQCPDGSTYSPPPQKVIVNTKPAVTVQPDLPKGAPNKALDWGGTFEADFKITNNNVQPYMGAVLTVSSSNAMNLQVLSADGMTCNNLGQNFTCTFNLDKQGAPGGTLVLKLNFTLPVQPKNLVDMQNYTLTSSLTLPNQSTAIPGSDIKFSLPPN